MDKKEMALGKANFIMMAASMAVIVIGFVLMSGGASSDEYFNPAQFDFRRTTLAPVTCFVGFVAMAASVMYVPRGRRGKGTDDSQKTW